MATVQEKVAGFLAQGLKPAQVASIVGLSPGRISQIVREPEFAPLLAAAQQRYEVSSDDQAAAARINNKYLALEDRLIDQLDSQAACMEPKDLIKALDVVAARQDRLKIRMAPAPAAASTQVLVNISMPAHALPDYKVNSLNEIVSIDEKPMAPLAASSVRQLFKDMAPAQEPPRIPADF